ncbi:S-adenosyl-L-methionine-dependent methyltransferase [Durotheca rogersii]|uniref:S-adenosyl-L-methionine-dependent methyltransferase n=1 Tax=Durotheca rogersii TaxID=419775 RepID=UPI002220B633|nr:S-adenosyl-L-methionine-dependent methyltransferase [Durotheca rogersii]KAI5861161.1 S-adenosyl-L-methionine-dependent methyltransferase [Durotheca rogersii]
MHVFLVLDYGTLENTPVPDGPQRNPSASATHDRSPMRVGVLCASLLAGSQIHLAMPKRETAQSSANLTLSAKYVALAADPRMTQEVKLSSAVSLLEGLAAHPSGIPAAIDADDQLRKRLLAVVQKLVPELETPAEASQRILYNALELPAARIAVDLDVFGQLARSADTPLTTEELTRGSGKAPDAKLLARVLRYLASFGFVREVGAGRWAASHLGDNLCGTGQSAGVCHMVDNCFAAFVALPAFLRRHAYRAPAAADASTDTAFALGNGLAPDAGSFFAWLRARPEHARSFNVFMGAHRTGVRSWLDDGGGRVVAAIARALAAVAAADPAPVAFVDIGGGVGHQCKALRKRAPHLQGRIVLEDLEEVVASAELEDGIEALGIDFLKEQPIKGKRRIVLLPERSPQLTDPTFPRRADWPDADARAILGHVRDAMGASSLLLVDELVLPDRGAHRWEAQLDLAMLAMLNAEARTEAAWRRLLADAGLAVVDLVFYEEDAREAVIVARKAA